MKLIVFWLFPTFRLNSISALCLAEIIDVHYNAHPNFIPWHWFLRYCGQAERLSQNHYPSPNISLHPDPNPDPNLNPNPNPNRRERNIRFTGWACGQNMEAFLPYVMWGDLESARKNTSIQIFEKYSELVNKKFWKIWASVKVKAEIKSKQNWSLLSSPASKLHNINME